MADISKVNLFGTQYNIADTEARKRVSESLLKDTVGWVGKNLFPIQSDVVTQTINGVTFTVTRNANGEVTEIDANGTATADSILVLASNSDTDFSSLVGKNLVLNGCPSNGSYQTYLLQYHRASNVRADVGNGIDLTINSEDLSSCRFRLIIINGYTANHVKFYPMLRDASITDSTFEPYHKSVEAEIEQVYADNGVLGAKNWFNPSSIYDGATNITVTESGKIIEIKNDTEGTYKRGTWKIPVVKNKIYVLKTDVVVTTGVGLIGISDSNNVDITTSSSITSNSSKELQFNSGNNEFVYIKLFSTTGTSALGDVTYNNLILKLASDPDDTYVPYAMTNRELTELATVQESAVTNIVSGASVDSSVGNHILKTGNVVQLVLRLNNVTMANTFATMCKIPEGFRPKYSFNSRDTLTNNGFAIQSNGEVLNREALSNATVVLCTTWITD